MNTYSVVVGDWSHDGHKTTINYYIKSDASQQDIAAAYLKGSKKLGFNLSEDFFKDYEDDTMDIPSYDKFVSLTGLDVLDGDYESFLFDDKYSIDSDRFVEMWLAVVKLGNPDIQVELQDSSCQYEFNIGGYGLLG